MGKIGMIISREYWTRVRKKSFIIMSILGPLLIGGFITLTIWLTISENKQYNVLVVDELGLTDRQFKNKEGVLNFSSTEKKVTKEEFAENESYDLMLKIEQNSLNGTPALMYYKKLPSLSIQSYINSELDAVMEGYRLMKAKTNPEVEKFINDEYPKIKKHVDITIKDVNSDENAKQKQYASIIGFAFAILIYMFIFMYGVQVMRGVIEEKTSRIVEIIISSVRPIELMMGKIIGIALVGLTQFILWVFFTATILIISQQLFFPDIYDPQTQAQITQVATEVDASPMTQTENFNTNETYDLVYNVVNWPLLLGMFLFYFIGGYLMYSALFAAIGAAVDAESDTQQFLMPVTIPLVFGFIVSEMALQNPESDTVFWTSMIPLTSPVVMMVRVAIGIPVWELLLSMFFLIAGFLFCTWLA
ncbi:MAG: ABC transporter permease, partial [Bacteroidota bacterium]